MKLMFGLFLAVVSASAFTCLDHDLAGLDPTTQKSSCLERWKSDRLVMIVEKDCIPCGELLSRMRKEMSKEQKKLVEMLWLDTNPSTCLANSLRFGDFGPQWCVSRNDVREKWQIGSSPVIFWMDEKNKKTHFGRPNEEKRLPWFRFITRSMLK